MHVNSAKQSATLRFTAHVHLNHVYQFFIEMQT